MGERVGVGGMSKLVGWTEEQVAFYTFSLFYMELTIPLTGIYKRGKNNFARFFLNGIGGLCGRGAP